MKIEKKKPSQQEIDMMSSWPIWEKEISEFDWEYDDREVCYLLEGHVIVESELGNVEFEAGDMMIFPKSLKCRWIVKTAVRKHYKFG